MNECRHCDESSSANRNHWENWVNTSVNNFSIGKSSPGEKLLLLLLNMFVFKWQCKCSPLAMFREFASARKPNGKYYGFQSRSEKENSGMTSKLKGAFTSFRKLLKLIKIETIFFDEHCNNFEVRAQRIKSVVARCRWRVIVKLRLDDGFIFLLC